MTRAALAMALVGFSGTAWADDLELYALDTLTDPIYAGQSFDFEWSVENTDSWNAYGGFNITLRASSNSSYDSSDTFICTRTVTDTIREYYSYDYQSSCTWPSGVLASYLVAEIESNDSGDSSYNNDDYVSVNVIPDGDIDFVATAITAPAGSEVGEPFSVGVTVRNDSENAMPGPSVRVRLSTDATLSGGDVSLCTGTIPGTLSVGGTGSTTLTCQTSAGQAQRQYYLIAEVDHTNAFS